MNTAFSPAQHPVDLYFWIAAIVQLSLIFSDAFILVMVAQILIREIQRGLADCFFAVYGFK